MDEDLFWAFKFCFRLLRAVGLWMDGTQTWRYIFWSCAVQCVCVVFTSVAILIGATETETLMDLAENLAFFVARLTMIYKCFNFLMKFKRIMKSIDDLNSVLEFSKSGDKSDNRDFLRSPVKLGHKVFRIYYISAGVAAMSGILPVIFAHRMPFHWWFPFDTKNSEIGFYSASFLELLNTPVIASINLSLGILPIIFLTFIIGLTDELCHRLNEIGKMNSSESNCEEELITCIKIHERIKKIAEDIQDNFASMILAQGMMASFTLCTAALVMSLVSLSVDKHISIKKIHH